MNSSFRFVLFALFFASIGCTITKRHYRSGYTIEWNINHKKDYNLQKDQNLTSSLLDSPKSYESTMLDTYHTGTTEIIIDSISLDQKKIIPIVNQHTVFTPSVLKAVKSTINIKKPKWKNHASKRAIYIENNTWEKIGTIGKVVMFVALFILVCVLIAFFLTSGSTGAGATDFIGLLLLIIFGLLGLLFISLFGLGGAFLFSLCLAAFGGLILLSSFLVLKRRNRYKDQ